jgi:oxygen-dependent protoporphyrinogen oxidase
MNSKDHEVIIIGAGLSGLSTARFLKDKQADLDLLILEESNRPGGVISSHSEEGYLTEWGPHGFLDNCLESRVLVHLAGLDGEVEKAPLKKFPRYICLNGKLNTIPQSPLKIIKAPILPLSAKLKICADLFKKPMPGEPSVSDWVAHRFGKDIIPFADAVFTGTYAGDIDRLSIDAVMPGVRNLEKQHGSVIKGVLKKILTGKKEDKNKKEQKKFTLPAMTSFRAGAASPSSRCPLGSRSGNYVQNNRQKSYSCKRWLAGYNLPEHIFL